MGQGPDRGEAPPCIYRQPCASGGISTRCLWKDRVKGTGISMPLHPPPTTPRPAPYPQDLGWICNAKVEERMSLAGLHFWQGNEIR